MSIQPVSLGLSSGSLILFLRDLDRHQSVKLDLLFPSLLDKHQLLLCSLDFSGFSETGIDSLKSSCFHPVLVAGGPLGCFNGSFGPEGVDLDCLVLAPLLH